MGFERYKLHFSKTKNAVKCVYKDSVYLDKTTEIRRC